MANKPSGMSLVEWMMLTDEGRAAMEQLMAESRVDMSAVEAAMRARLADPTPDDDEAEGKEP